MTALGLCWPIFALWYMWWGSTHFLASTQTTDANFEIEKGIRYGCGVTYNRSTGSVIECAAECAREKSCYGFHFGFGRCEQLSATAYGRLTAPGWTHGNYPTGKYEIRYQQISYKFTSWLGKIVYLPFNKSFIIACHALLMAEYFCTQGDRWVRLITSSASSTQSS